MASRDGRGGNDDDGRPSLGGAGPRPGRIQSSGGARPKKAAGKGEPKHESVRPAKPKAPRKSRFPGLMPRLGGALIRFVLVGGIWGLIVVLIGLAWIARDLPNPDRLKAANPHPSIQILAANGEALAIRGDAYGKALDFDDLPPYLVQALIATEDRRFYSHPGFDVIGFGRALAVNLMRGHFAQG